MPSHRQSGSRCLYSQAVYAYGHGKQVDATDRRPGRQEIGDIRVTHLTSSVRKAGQPGEPGEIVVTHLATGDFGDVRANVLNAFAERDNVVPAVVSAPVMDLVGDPARREELRLTGGHVTFGAGSHAFKRTLPALSHWLAEHSDELDTPKER